MLLDKFGRVKITCGIDIKCYGFVTHHYYTFASILIIGRIIQGFVCSMYYASLLFINEYYIGTRRQRALSYWSIGSWGGSGICTLFGGLMATYRLAFNICCFNSINFISNVLNQTAPD